MSEKNERRKGPYGRPAPRPEGRPAPAGRPAGGRSYARPKPGDAPRSGPYGRPAPKPEGEPRHYVRPAPAVPQAEGEPRRYGRPAPAVPQAEGEPRRYARPAPAVPQAEGEPRRYGRPAPKADNESRRYARPAPGKPPYARPAFGKPAYSKPAQPRPAPAAPSVSSDARRSALEVLNRVLLDSAYASLTLDEHFNLVRLSPRDKRLCTHLVYLTLENLGRLDFALDRLLEDPERLEKRVRNLLRLSACQILLLDRVPDSAAVNEAVKIARDMGLEELTGLVNGVLRNLIRGMADIPWPKPEEGLRYYEVMYSQPPWLAERILKHYGPEEGHRILTYRQTQRWITLRPNLGRVSAEAFQALLAKKPWGIKKGILPNAWYVSGVNDISRDEDYLLGNFAIQGEGSMLAAMALSPRLGSQVLDCCAAPGGKAALISELLQGSGRVHAWDVHPHRVELISALADRLRLYNIRPAVRDALVYREQLEQSMDALIIDAPCTGSGVMDDKPDIRLRLREEGLNELVATQAGLLKVCSRYLKPGGTLVYATCSLLPEENQQQVERFLSENEAFRMDPLPDSIPESLRSLAGPFGLQLLPHRDQTEGFFIARMRRQ